MISASELKSEFSYDSATGCLKWLADAPGRRFGVALTGIVYMKGERKKASHIAWAIFYGEWPKTFVFFRNKDKKDLRLCNLEVAMGQNGTSKKLSDEEIRDRLRYDSVTGSITKSVCGSEVPADRDCVINGKNYKTVSIRSNAFLAHRLAWFLHHGHWPKNHIDHRDGDGRNNAIANLRDVTRSENRKNSGTNKRNKSGVTGVHWNPDSGKWHASIGHNGRAVYLGLFSSFDDAKKARLDAEKDFGFSDRHGKTPSECMTKSGIRIPDEGTKTVRSENSKRKLPDWLIGVKIHRTNQENPQ